MKTRLLLFLSLMLFVCAKAQNNNENSTLFSQTTIIGTVIDKNNDTPLPYAYLTIDKLGLGTVTDEDGKFKINIPKRYDTYSIKISYIGFEDLIVKVVDFKARNGDAFAMIAKTVSLDEVVLGGESEKMPSAKDLLKKVIKRIPTNYGDSPTLLNGYYRETMKENGVYIKYSDAVNSLHRIHFHHRTLKNEQVQIINARSSSSLSKRDFHANIGGGPLSLFARNRVKYQESFLGKKARRDFTYKISEELDETGTWVYVLDFHTKTTKKELDELASPTNRRQWKRANKRKLLKGRIYIDQKDLAVVRYECTVPNQLKQYFCGYDGYNTDEIKHFDYKLDVRFKKKGKKYYIDNMRHEDEFVFKDSINQTTTFYSAISEFKTKNITTQKP